jgi:hypothetical protein
MADLADETCRNHVKKGGGSPWGKDYRLAAPHWGEPVPRVEPKLDEITINPKRYQFHTFQLIPSQKRLHQNR